MLGWLVLACACSGRAAVSQPASVAPSALPEVARVVPQIPFATRELLMRVVVLAPALSPSWSNATDEGKGELTRIG